MSVTALPEAFLERLRQNNDIISVITSYVGVKRAGRDYVCSCPFHSERTPSCHIYTESQSFYCFGCGAGGDVITFIRLIEHLDYIESVKFLAQRAGMSMPEDEYDRSSEKKTRLLEMNREAARFYRDLLLSEEGAEGREYLASRQLLPNTVRKYGLGYAPNDWHTLHFHLRQKGYTDDEMAAGALLSRNNNKYYDKFRHRVMFPIIDRRGNVIAFGGRTLDADSPAKYLNSDETLVFQKRNNLFSLNFAKNTKQKFFILCEGYMDVIALNQAGFENAVATLGTAITADQARLMKQYCDEVVISYDSDEAGQKATMKAINLLTEAGIAARVLQMQDAKDPDEYIKKNGASSFAALLEKSGSALDFEFGKVKRGHNTDTAEGKAAFLKKAIAFLAQLTSETDKVIYVSETAKITEQSAQTIRELVKDEEKRRYYRQAKEEKRELIRSVVKRDPINPEAMDYPTEEKAERGIIAYLFHSPDKLGYIFREISLDDFPTEFNRRVATVVTERLKNNQSIDISSLGGEFSAAETGRITGICKEADILPYTPQRLDEYIQTLRTFRDSKNRKSGAEMTTDELMKYMDELKKAKLK